MLIRPEGQLKAIKCMKRYIMFLDFDDTFTKMYMEFYSMMCDGDVELLDTGYKIDLGCFEYITAELLMSYMMDKYTFVDIIHVLKYAIQFYMKRRNFLFRGITSKRAIHLIDDENTSNSHQKNTYVCIYNNVLKKAICVYIQWHNAKVIDLLTKQVYNDFEVYTLNQGNQGTYDISEVELNKRLLRIDFEDIHDAVDFINKAWGDRETP